MYVWMCVCVCVYAEEATSLVDRVPPGCMVIRTGLKNLVGSVVHPSSEGDFWRCMYVQIRALKNVNVFWGKEPRIFSGSSSAFSPTTTYFSKEGVIYRFLVNGIIGNI